MKVACYFPNKPTIFVTPSGDRTISQYLVAAIEKRGHRWEEMSLFRSRWFWLNIKQSAMLMPCAFWALSRSLIFQPDLWLTYHSYYKSPDPFGWLICKYVLRKPYVLFQSMYSTKRRRDLRTRPGYYLNFMALRSADLVFSNNLMDLEDLKRIVPEERLIYTPPGIFPEEFIRDDSSRVAIRKRYGIGRRIPVLLTVCRFRMGVKWLSLKFLFKALSLLVGRSWVLIIVGSGPMKDQAKELAYRFLGEKAVFVGEVPRGELYRYYSAADVFVFPGIGESLGMVYLEAQACELPVVALDGPGVRQVVKHGHGGILVENHDRMAYADAVSSLLDDANLRSEMGAKGRKFIETERNARVVYDNVVREMERLVCASGRW